jgi:hypothetical protein
MSSQDGARKAIASWSIIGAIAFGCCAVTGILFGQTALWGTAGAMSALYIGALGIWVSRRDRPPTGSVTSSPASRGVFVAASYENQHETNGAAMDGTNLKVGSPEFAELIHELVDQIDDPVDITDAATRAGIKMSLARTGGPQTPLNLWTAVLTRAVRDGVVDRLMGEAGLSRGLPPAGVP